MRVFRIAVPLLLAATLAGCGGSEENVAMPNVTGKKLDVAYDELADAGMDDKDKVKVEGGGIFGVVKEGNWTVCEQEPAAGDSMTDEPKLTVDRSCDTLDDAEAEERPSETPLEEPTESQTPEEEPTESEIPEEEPTESETPEVPDVLTVKNSSEFAALLKLGDNCSGEVASFAKTYNGQKVEFDGAVIAMAPHGDYDTRFDFLVGAGDFDPNTASGPSFQFRDKNAFDLNLTGKTIPDYVRVGQNYTFVAELGDYSRNTCLFQLDPVETKVR